MERELGKTLMEIECSIKNHERRGNTHTQSVLEQARDIIAICAEATRTPSGLREMLMRDTTDGWIPVEERLPEDGHEVLCCDNAAVYLVEYQADWDAPFGDMDDIIAWRPLPEPYRPKKESEGSRRLREREEFFKG